MVRMSMFMDNIVIISSNSYPYGGVVAAGPSYHWKVAVDPFGHLSSLVRIWASNPLITNDPAFINHQLEPLIAVVHHFSFIDQSSQSEPPSSKVHHWHSTPYDFPSSLHPIPFIHDGAIFGSSEYSSIAAMQWICALHVNPFEYWYSSILRRSIDRIVNIFLMSPANNACDLPTHYIDSWCWWAFYALTPPIPSIRSSDTDKH